MGGGGRGWEGGNGRRKGKGEGRGEERGEMRQEVKEGSFRPQISAVIL